MTHSLPPPDDSPPPPGHQPRSAGNNHDDLALVSFLKSHAPPVPDAPVELEAQLMTAIHQEHFTPAAVAPGSQRRLWIGWRNIAFIGVGIAVVGIVLGQVQRWLSPPGLSTAQLAALESFMVGSWDDVLDPNDPFSEWDVVPAPSRFPPLQPTPSSFSTDSEP